MRCIHKAMTGNTVVGIEPHPQVTREICLTIHARELCHLQNDPKATTQFLKFHKSMKKHIFLLLFGFVEKNACDLIFNSQQGGLLSEPPGS